jgi:DNA polymerase-3 subunit alpha
MPTPLHNHSHYSFPTGRDGLSKPSDIAARVKELGYEAVAITDHDVVAGHIDFHRTISEAGLKPILGIEAYQAPISRFEHASAQSKNNERLDNYHLVLLAQNNEGLRNLWVMNTESHKGKEVFWFHGRVDWDLLERYNKGIVATSACGISMLSWAIKYGNPDDVIQRYLNIFGDRFFIELHTYSEDWQKDLNVQLVSLANTYGIPLVYANDAHYARPEQHDLHEAIMCLGMNAKVKDTERLTHAPDLYIMDEDDIRKHLSYLPKSVIDQAIANSDLIASQCEVSLPERRNRVPVFIPDRHYTTSREMLFDLAVQGYSQKITALGLPDDVYLPRFEKEIKVIFEVGLVDYFLITRDFINWAKEQGVLVGPGRGSVGGSLIAYLIGIHELDPIKYGLIFERFYNAGRETGMPDIDVDFPSSFRDTVKDYLVRKYGGEDYVADLCNIGTMQAKASIKDMGRVLSINMRDTDQISNLLENTIKQGLQAESWEEIEEELGEELAPWEKKYPQLFEHAKALHHFIRTYGVHASGVIISDEPLPEVYPLKWNVKKEKLVTQFDMDIAGDFGFMKMDLLAIRNLDTLTEFNKILKEEGREPVDFYSLRDEDCSEEMWKLLDDGLTVGIFQVEDGGLAKQMMKEIKPRSIEDIAVAISLNRPGPMDQFARYMVGRNGGPVKYAHPYLESILKPTYGVFLYQEQVIEYMRAIGYDLMEADNVRSIMGKKKVEKVTAELERYLPKALDHMDEKTAMSIWEQLVRFSRYGFNKSHGVGYGTITFWTTYAKWYDPTVFMLAGIRTVDKDDIPRYVNEARRFDIAVLPPRINESGVNVTRQGDKIIYGFNNIKGIGVAPAKWIVEHQPYDDVGEFISSVQLYKTILPNGQKRVAVDKGKIKNLIYLGAFGDNAEWNEKIKKDTFETHRPLKEAELFELEEELLGVALSDDSATILTEYQDEIDKLCTPLDMMYEEGEYTVAGVVKELRDAKTKKGDAMMFVTIENEPITLEFAVWSNVKKRLDFMLRRRTAGLFHIKRDKKGRYSLLNARVLHRRNIGQFNRAA